MRADRAKSIPAVVRDVPFGYEGASQTCTVIGRNVWTPTRINVSTRDLDGTRKYCSSERYYAMNSLLAITSVKVTFFYAEKGKHLLRYTLLPLLVNGLRAVRGDVASFSVLNDTVVREGVFPNSRMLSCRGRGHSHSVCGRASRGFSRLSGWWGLQQRSG
ncbi:hypothetical protein TcBrA4_0111800 [Trypanosoma cruzi]|nr:hypothetical protein TcBrA4_0111800 [Trypanosoma cruzi]